ncbi:MAG: hypothetical protein QNJ97_22465 [Myxococcota bacterium]|nr:hypothetical protein [Myxococcota bacterium]
MRTMSTLMALFLSSALFTIDTPAAVASGTKTVTGSGIKPTDVVDKALLTSGLLPEGKKIAFTCVLSPLKSGRHRLRSVETGREYTVLENSLLEEMVKTGNKTPDQRFAVTARVTTFEGKNFVFITKVSLDR